MEQFSFKTLTNITGDEFTFKIGGKEIVLEKGETVKLEDYIADHGAKHMAIQIINHKKGAEIQRIADASGKDYGDVRVHMNPYTGQEHDKLVALALGKQKVDYTNLSKEELLELAIKHNIETKQKNGRFRIKTDLIKDLNEIDS